ncbi:MAG: phosphate ABC transporter permease subunit PstC [Solirubrobacteraceae bacterium]
MAASPLSPAPPPLPLSRVRRSLPDRLGDPTLRTLTSIAAIASLVLLALIVYKVFGQASEAFSRFGLGFVVTSTWNPTTGQFGAAALLFGTAVSSLLALLIAAPMSIAIALFLTELAPRTIRRPVATLVELLAAIPSVVLGLWGILVLGPFLENTLEPALHGVLGWIPLFSGTPSSRGMLAAVLILTIMTVPIVSAITREVFETVPREQKEGALALGATRWEMVRMVILPYARTGIVGATVLGLGRALGEAIAVAQVIGGNAGIHVSLFQSADTLASRIASEYQGAATSLQISSLAYLAAILLVLAVVVNAIARLIVRRTALKIPTTPGIVR